MKPPIKYVGSKNNASKYLISLFPKHKVYVEVFFGAGAILFAKQPSKQEIVNDIDNNIVNLFTVIKEKPSDFLKQAEYTVYSRKLFYDYVESLNEGSDIERAYKFFYVINSTFNAKTSDYFWITINNTRGYPAKQLHSKLELIPKIHNRLKHVIIDNCDFEEMIKRYDTEDSFFFLDPPYYNIKLYKHSFTENDFIRLRDALKNLKGKFLMTINDHEWIRNTFKDFYINEYTIHYNSNSVNKKELLFSNYKIPKQMEL